MTMLLLFLTPLLFIPMALEDTLATIFQVVALVIMALIAFLVVRLLIVKNYPRSKRPQGEKKTTT